MKLISNLILMVFFAATAYASDSIKEFSFTTVDGKSVAFKAGSGTGMVVKVCSAS